MIFFYSLLASSSLVFPLTDVSCNFEVNLCGWYQDQTDNYDWSLHSGMDHTIHVGQDTFDVVLFWVNYIWLCYYIIITKTSFFTYLSLSQVGVWWWICGTIHCEVFLDDSSQSDSKVTPSTVCPSSTNSMGQTQVDLNTLFPASQNMSFSAILWPESPTACAEKLTQTLHFIIIYLFNH